jgi:uncharacterized protein (TIGR03435 family)
MMTEHIANKLNFSKSLLLTVTGVLAVTIPIVSGVLSTPVSQAQTAAPDVSGTWQGTLATPGNGLRTVVKISKADAGGAGGGGWKAALYSIDQGGQPIPVTSVSLQGTTFKFTIAPLDLVYAGTLSADGKTITGKSTQHDHTFELDLTLTTPDNVWAIPEPQKPMAADAHPMFDVVTIKLSQTQTGRNWGVRGSHVRMIGGTLEGLIEISYGLHAKQILNAPDWFSSYRFDIDGVPNVGGRPSQDQMKEMFQELLADRFKLVFHHDKKELAVYAITVAKGGPKLTKSDAAATDPEGFLFTGLGVLNVRNETMVDFAKGMQRSVTDKPVVDQTGLTDRYDFKLVWTPDETQFSGLGVKVTPPTTDNPNAPPGLYPAIQEQLGLRLEATKAMTDVIVIDHVEKPSAN